MKEKLENEYNIDIRILQYDFDRVHNLKESFNLNQMIKEYLLDIKCKILINALSEDVREDKSEGEANCGVF